MEIRCRCSHWAQAQKSPGHLAAGIDTKWPGNQPPGNDTHNSLLLCTTRYRINSTIMNQVFGPSLPQIKMARPPPNSASLTPTKKASFAFKVWCFCLDLAGSLLTVQSKIPRPSKPCGSRRNSKRTITNKLPTALSSNRNSNALAFPKGTSTQSRSVARIEAGPDSFRSSKIVFQTPETAITPVTSRSLRSRAGHTPHPCPKEINASNQQVHPP
jgi:hypothetical protein